tara:strand:- start:407 stop:1012 length:606 start_codon:yes stop_codon:yes gene_type:complete
MSINVCNNNSLSAITSIPDSITAGALTLISTQTASSSSTISFTSGIDSTYKEYIFKFYDIHPASDSVDFQFNLSVDGGSNYNVAKTTSFFRAFNFEDDSAQAVQYQTGEDLAQGTGFQSLSDRIGNDADASCAGTLHLFDPSNTTFVKHFIARFNRMFSDPVTANDFVGGYGNTTSAVNAVQFKFSSGNIDAGTIKLYGVS